MDTRELERIAEDLRRSREEIEKAMDDSATKLNSADLLQRIDALRLRIDASQRPVIRRSR